MVWDGIVPGDYDRAVLRLATITRQRVNMLVFGWIELLPPEMPAPPEAATASTGSGDRLYFTRTVMPLGDALNWYASCWSAEVASNPASPVDLHLGTNAPEPPGPRFVLQGEIPFSPAWHVMPRVHRLVPMAEPALPVAQLVAGMATVPKHIRARAWLLDRLHFDILAHDDWLGSLCLVAPNPVAGQSAASIADRTAGQETLQVRGRVRQGISSEGVRIVFQERRAGGAGYRDEVPIDGFGRASTTIPDQVMELGHQMVCPKRGLLHDEAPGWFFRSVTLGSQAQIGTRVVQPPQHRRSTAALTPLVTSVWRREPEPASAVRSPVLRLEELRRRREDRFGAYRPLATDAAPDDVRAFEIEREEAILFLRKLVGQARRRVMLVDPYLEPGDLQLFAYAAEREGVGVQALISPRPGYYTAPVDGIERGDALLAQIAAMRDPKLRFGAIDVRVAVHRRLHDRFLRIDDGLWHSGHSFNGVGSGELSVVSRIAKPAELLQLLESLFNEAEPFDAWWAGRAANPLAESDGGTIVRGDQTRDG